jgi:predicted metalloprotease with PDZ domain
MEVLVQKGTQGIVEENVEVIANETTKIALSLEEGINAIEEAPQGVSMWGATFAKQKNRYVVLAVEPDSIADLSDLFAGDTIQSIDGVKAATLSQEEFLEQMKTAVQIMVISKEGELQEVELRR